MNTFVPHYQRSRTAQDGQPAWKPRPFTQRQAEFISSLLKQRGITAEQLVAVFPSRPETFSDGSKVISWLKEQPMVDTSPPLSAQEAEGLAPVPKDGKKAKAWHYALRSEDGEVKFYRVKRGRKPGFYFLDVQASDEYYPIKNPVTKKAILATIAADPMAALALYGQEVGACGRCGRTLTSEYRKLGIGPVCIDK